MAIRYPRGTEGAFRTVTEGEAVCVREGRDITLLGYGTMINEVLSAAEMLEAEGISAEVIKINRIHSDDFSLTMASLRKTGRFLSAEEVCAVGCVGRRVLARAGQTGVCLRAARVVTLRDGIVVHGGREQLLRDYGLDAQSLAATAKRLMEKESV